MAPASHSFDLLPDRIKSKIRIDEESGCWQWIAATNGRGGYGYIRWGSRHCQAHRLTYHLLADADTPIKPGRGSGALVLDHFICNNPGCVNPSHLQPVSNRRNLSRIGGSSRYVGVQWCKRYDRWRASTKLPGESANPRFLGYYVDEETAAHVYDAACFILTGDHPNLSSGHLDRAPHADEIATARRRLTPHLARGANEVA